MVAAGHGDERASFCTGSDLSLARLHSWLENRYQTEQESKDSILHMSRIDITPAGARAQVAIFVPRHELAREVKEVIERNRDRLGEPVVVPVLRGRDNGAANGRHSPRQPFFGGSGRSLSPPPRRRSADRRHRDPNDR
jgi:hypothetical protein